MNLKCFVYILEKWEFLQTALKTDEYLNFFLFVDCDLQQFYIYFFYAQVNHENYYLFILFTFILGKYF